MPVKEDSHADLARVSNDLVHDLKRIQPVKIRISIEVDAAGYAAGIQRLSAVRQTKSVVSEALHLVEHVPPVSSPQSMRTEVFVSMPNQLIPVILTGWPFESKNCLPFVFQNPLPLPDETFSTSGAPVAAHL